MSRPNHAPEITRYPRLDQLRGTAIVIMVVFHFCYDLTWLGWLHLNLLGAPFWTGFRSLIVTTFVAVSGATLMLSHTPDRSWFSRRETQLLAAALLVSLVSAWLFGSRWIYFGVLHFFLVGTLLTRPWLNRPWLLGIAGLALVTMGNVMGFEFMDPKALNWIGLAAHKPFTEDYAPLIPWLGVLWLGAWAASFKPAWLLNKYDETWLRPLTWAGQHALLIYLLHQPLLLAILNTLRWLKG